MDDGSAKRGGTWHPGLFFSHRIESAAQADRLNAEGGIAVRFDPLAARDMSLRFDGAQSASLSLWRTASPSGFLSAPQFDADVITIRFVLDGAMIRRDHRRDHVGLPGQAMMVTFEAMRNEQASRGFEALSGTVTRGGLAAGHRDLEGEGALPDFEPVADATGLAMATLMRTMDRIHGRMRAGVAASDLVFPLLEEIVVYQLLSAWPRRGPGATAARPGLPPRPVRRAKDYIDGHLAHRLLLADVARAAGVSVRRLQTAFKAETGRTPVQFILEQRLDRARADLLAAGADSASVGTVAARWGFTHAGDFGRRYRARFGEAPSATLRRPPAGR